MLYPILHVELSNVGAPYDVDDAEVVSDIHIDVTGVRVEREDIARFT